jgi:Fic family protein
MRPDNNLPALKIPPVRREKHWWNPSNNESVSNYISRSQKRRETGEYMSTIPPDISLLKFSIPSDISADMEEAAKALGEFDSYADVKLGSGSKVLGPMSSILLRTESTSSSQMENLTVGAKNLALQELGEGGGNNAEVVVGNVRAMEATLSLAERIDATSVKEIHEALLSDSTLMNGSVRVGQYRTDLVWVGGSASGPVHAKHVAPQADLVEDLMEDLFAFIERDDLPVILQCAIAHAQFETIHPFGDGNGRVGRALIHAILRNKKMVKNTTVPLSAGLLTDLERYFEALNSFRDGDARPIVERLTFACRFAAGTGIQLIDSLMDQLTKAREKLASVRRDATVWKVLPYLVNQPIISSEYLQTELLIPAARARKALSDLEERGVLTSIKGKRRNIVWEHKGIIAVLNEYSEQLRRQ